MGEKENPVRAASKRSMSCAKRKVKGEWLSLFADDAILEDPIGRSLLDKEGNGHRGKAAISAFYNRNIASGARRFETKDSFACGEEVANVGNIHITFPDGKVALCEGMFVYKVDGEGKLFELLRRILHGN
jgi:steroid delta-isomerase